MNDKLNNSYKEALQLTDQLRAIARKEMDESCDDNSILLFGLIRDSCFRIKKEIERELRRLKSKNSSKFNC